MTLFKRLYCILDMLGMLNNLDCPVNESPTGDQTF